MKKCLFYIFVFISIYSYGQEFDLPKILPPSPNAASLGNYGQIPVGLFTGTPQITIPIYNVSDGKLTLPISLSYSSNGIRVDEMASNVGLAWNLNAGGVITRNINDGPDEEPYFPKPTGFPNTNSEDVLNYIYNFTDPDNGSDTQSDSYSFNFNGYSGSFYLNENRVPIQNNSSPLKIVKDPQAPYTQYEFIIIDPYGVTYCFGNSNSTEETKYQQVGTGGHPVPGFYMPTSWYLSKVENVFGDEINLTYTNKDITYDAAISQSVTSKANENGPSEPGENLIITRTFLKSKQLNSILTSNVQINFGYSLGICAFQGDFSKLDQIQVNHAGAATLKKFVLAYDIITSNLQNLKNPHINYRDCYGKRLFLKSITEYGDGANFKNPYTFSYYSPDQIPPRFSYSQDYWGYYNGISNNEYLVSNGNYFFAHESNAALLEGLFHDVGGNKKPNGTLGKNGLLKKVIYPTGGFNELFYEPHSYYGTKIIPPQSGSLTLTPNTVTIDCAEPTEEQRTKTATIGPIPFTHSSLIYPDLFSEAKVPITVNATFDEFCYEHDCQGDDPTHGNFAQLSIKDHNTPSRAIKLYKRTQTGAFLQVANPQSISPSNGPETIYVDLEEDITYDIKYYIYHETSRCTSAYMNFSYYPTDFTEIDTNIEVGGSRIQKIITNDDNGNEQEKIYHYGDKDCLGCSSGISEKPIPSIAYTRYSTFTPYNLPCGGCGTIHEVDQLTLSSGNLYNLYGRSGHQIGYESVIEEYGEDFIGGGIFHKFQITPDTGPYKERESWPVPGTPFDKNFGTGNELEYEVFSKSNNEYKTVKRTVNHYEEHPLLSLESLNYNIRLRDIYGIGIAVGNEAKINSFDIFSYFQKSAFLYMDSSTTWEYDDNSVPKAVSTTNYDYDNPGHLQPTRVTISRVGDNKTLITKTDYPGDLLTFPYMGSLKNQHRIAEPIRIRAYQDIGNGEELLSTQHTVYDDFGNIYLPKFMQTAKGAEPLQNRLVYSSYDGHGNLREVYQPNGSRTVYVMGYDFALPVAKLENVALSDIPQGLLDNIYSASGSSGNETLLLQRLDELRIHIDGLNKSTLVTTLTFIPLVGVHTVTDPKGYSMTYTYDDFGRLQYVKDMEENVLSENQYHYIND